MAATGQVQWRGGERGRDHAVVDTGNEEHRMRRPMIARHISALSLTAFLVLTSGHLAGAQESPSPAVPSPATSAPQATDDAPPAAPTAGITWKISTKGQDFDTDPIATGVTQGPDGMVYIAGLVVDKAGVPTVAFWYSEDLKRWTRSLIDDPPGSGAVAIVTNPKVPEQALMEGSKPGTGGFSAIGASAEGALVWSWADERRWVSQVVPEVSFADLTISDAALHAVGQFDPGPEGKPAMWSAPDALSWTGSTISAAGQAASPGQAQAVALAPDGTFVVAGSVSDPEGTAQVAVWQSTDGTVWTPVVSEELAGLTSIGALEWTPVGFVLAASENQEGTGRGVVLVSTDGLGWQTSLEVTDDRITALGYTGTDVIAFGADRTWQSADAVTWLEAGVPEFRGYTVGAVTTLTDGRLVAVGRLEGQKGAKIASWVGKVAP